MIHNICESSGGIERIFFLGFSPIIMVFEVLRLTMTESLENLGIREKYQVLNDESQF